MPSLSLEMHVERINSLFFHAEASHRREARRRQQKMEWRDTLSRFFKSIEYSLPHAYTGTILDEQSTSRRRSSHVPTSVIVSEKEKKVSPGSGSTVFCPIPIRASTSFPCNNSNGEYSSSSDLCSSPTSSINLEQPDEVVPPTFAASSSPVLQLESYERSERCNSESANRSQSLSSMSAMESSAESDKSDTTSGIVSDPTETSDVSLMTANSPEEKLIDHDESEYASQQSKGKRGRKRAIADEQKDDAYWERRRRNNIAAKKSRDLRRAKELEVLQRHRELEARNKELKRGIQGLLDENNSMEHAIQSCKQLLLQHGYILPMT